MSTDRSQWPERRLTLAEAQEELEEPYPTAEAAWNAMYSLVQNAYAFMGEEGRRLVEAPLQKHIEHIGRRSD